MKKKLIYTSLGVALVVLTLWGSTQALVIAGNEHNDHLKLSDGELVLVDTGCYTVAIVIDPFDIYELPIDLDKKPCFIQKSIPVSPEMIKALTFYEKGGDMATVSSKIYLKNGKSVIFKGGLILSDALVGIQHERFGWLEAKYPVDFIDFVKSLRSCSSPILIL